jgi:hypothetical protein
MPGEMIIISQSFFMKLQIRLGMDNIFLSGGWSTGVSRNKIGFEKMLESKGASAKSVWNP